VVDQLLQDCSQHNSRNGQLPRDEVDCREDKHADNEVQALVLRDRTHDCAFD
jgi:hypothetical protein